MSSESNIQANIRLAAAQDRVFLMRNNSGALTDNRGRLVRFGLGNDSPAINAKLKSSDLVGIRPILIQPEHVGQTIGQFIGVECKKSDFRGPAGDEHAMAQAAWMELVRAWGGVAGFGSTVEMARQVWKS